ncbi:MAG: hypothetical protein AB7G11_02720 [Phycisphaerales bacterium]
MPITVTRQPPVIRITGSDFAPPDLVFASQADREAYWLQVAVLARDAKYQELHQGIDIHGQRRYRKRRRRDRANGPFLTPHRSGSRMRTELRWDQYEGRGAILYWLRPWATVVGHWASGVRGVVHDVIGFTAKSIDRIKRKAFAWWSGRAAHRRAALVRGGDDGLGAQEAALGIHGRRVADTLRRGVFGPSPTEVLVAGRGPDVARNVPGVAFTQREPAWTLMQKLRPLWDAASVRRTTRAAIEATVTSLDATQTEATLVELVRRFGVTEPIPTKARAVVLIRANLVERWRSARPFGGMAPEPPPPPPRPPRTPTPTQPPLAPRQPSLPTRARVPVPVPVPLAVPVGATPTTPPIAAKVGVFDALRLKWLGPTATLPPWVRGFVQTLTRLGSRAAAALFARTEPTLSTDFLTRIAAAFGMRGPWDARATLVSALRDHLTRG